MTKQTESTGQILSIAMRENATRRHIKNQLARLETELHVLGESTAAKCCVAAIKAIEKERNP